jgi:hypothetical protein
MDSADVVRPKDVDVGAVVDVAKPLFRLMKGPRHMMDARVPAITSHKHRDLDTPGLLLDMLAQLGQ